MKRSHLIALPSLLSNAAALHTVFLIFAYMDAPMADQTGLLIWWLCLGGTYAALSLFLRKDRTLRGVILIAILGFSIQLGLTLALGVRYPSVLSWLFLLILWGGLYFRCCDVLQRPIPPEQLMLSFELTVGVLFITAFLCSAQALPSSVLLRLAAAVALSLIALARQRGGAPRAGSAPGNALRRNMLLILLPTGVGAVTIGCTLLFTNGAAALLTRLGSLIKAAAAAIFHGFESFMSFLVSLFPSEDLEPIDPLEGAGELELSSGGQGAVQYQSDLIVYIAVAAVIITAIAAVVYLLYRSGRSRRIVSVRRGGKQHRSGGGLRSVCKQIRDKLLFWLRYLRCRNTPPGLLIWLERKLHRRPEESPRAFLSRCAAQLPNCAQELSTLADWLDQFYFSPQVPQTALPVAEIRRKLRKSR